MVMRRIGLRCWWDLGTAERDQDSEVQVAVTEKGLLRSLITGR